MTVYQLILSKNDLDPYGQKNYFKAYPGAHNVASGVDLWEESLCSTDLLGHFGSIVFNIGMKEESYRPSYLEKFDDKFLCQVDVVLLKIFSMREVYRLDPAPAA